MSNHKEASGQREQSFTGETQEIASIQELQGNMMQTSSREKHSFQKSLEWSNSIQMHIKDVSLSNEGTIEQGNVMQTSTLGEPSFQEMPEKDDIVGKSTVIMPVVHQKEKQSPCLPTSFKETSVEGVSQGAITSVSPPAMKENSDKNRLSTILPSYSFKGIYDKKKPFVILLSCIVGLLLVTSVFVWQYLKNLPPDVVIYPATTQDAKLYVGGGGTVQPRVRLDIAYPAAELITNIYVKAGDQVKANQQLLQVDLSQLNAQVTQAANDVASAQQYQQSVIATGNSATIAQAQNAYNIAQNKYNALAAQASSPTLHNGVLIAPLDGIVTKVNANSGQVVPANTPLLTIEDESAVTVDIKVPVTDLSHVSLNQTALIYPSALPDFTGQGTVTNIIPEVDPQTDTFEVWVGVGNKDGKLLSGMNAFVRLERDVHAIVVPRLAVLNTTQNPTVFILRNQRAYMRHVQIAGFANDFAVISAGLSNGDKVILTGQNQLQDGQMVNVQAIEGSKKKA